MKNLVAGMTVWSVLIIASWPARAAGGLELNQAMTPGAPRYFDHHQEILLSNGFAAQAGTDVTVTINQAPGFYLDKTPLDSKDKQYTFTERRAFVAAGCVPQTKLAPGSLLGEMLTHPVGGSVWVVCNDLDGAKDKVIESPFLSCLGIHRNGVLQELFIKEINNRTWESFRFSCGDLRADGTAAGPFQKAAFLFNFEREGTLYQSGVPSDHLTLGLFELENYMQSRESLLTVALLHQSAQHIFQEGEKNRQAEDIKLSPKVPPSNPHLLRFYNWYCPPGMVVTGAAIGHIPDNKGNDTRPVYILAECRKLLHNP